MLYRELVAIFIMEHERVVRVGILLTGVLRLTKVKVSGKRLTCFRYTSQRKEEVLKDPTAYTMTASVAAAGTLESLNFAKASEKPVVTVDEGWPEGRSQLAVLVAYLSLMDWLPFVTVLMKEDPRTRDVILLIF